MCQLLVGESGITVSVVDESGFGLTNPNQWGDVAVVALLGEGVERGHVDLVFVTVERMTELNEVHMGASGPTDVLAFPMDAPQLAGSESLNTDPNLDGLPVHLGDIVICSEVSSSQAPDHVGSIDGELCLLTIHAALHLLGYDHVTTKERLVMQAREGFHLASFGFEHPVSVSD